ncbi:MAG: hypothetical protein WCS43_15635 [Verrucomicrobiota bacterium]
MPTLTSKPFLLSLAIAATLACFSPSAQATANYDYGDDEYVTITKGLSPDGRFAITAHGEGESGYDKFHLYLTDAVTGRHIGPLVEVDPILDTEAGAFGAVWSKDSSSVTIIWRWSRHDPFKSITYKISPKGAVPNTKKAVDVDKNSKLIEFWSKQCSGNTPTEKRFGTPKKK